MAPKPRNMPSADACIDALIEKLGRKIVLGLPLGIGKANHVVNALYQRAAADPSIDLTIFTALTLERPGSKNDLERRFIEPLNDRLFDGYVDLDYAKALRTNTLPGNITIHEFFLTPGSALGMPTVQRNYISVNYTHGARTLHAMGVNVIAQMIAKREGGTGPRYSLSCNTDVTLDVVKLMRAETDRPYAIIGQVNDALPFMPNDAEVAADYFDFLIDEADCYFPLFAPPKPPVSLADFAAGFHAASLVKDGGTLQIGIGSLADAITYALDLRHRHNKTYCALLEAFETAAQELGADVETRETKPFDKGIYGASEMIVDGFLHMADAGIVKRRVYDWTKLQQLINQGKIADKIGPDTLKALLEANALNDPPAREEFERLQYFGILGADAKFSTGKKLSTYPLGTKLENGVFLHGGFFLGPSAFYQQLRDLPEDMRQAINMTAISFVNELYGDQALKAAQRVNARFINTAMMATLTGSIISDGLENGAVVSGVGGQYNFVTQAHALKDARSIIALRATRTKRGKLKSNILWSYGHATIPRHLRDIVVTEYGAADLRGRSDSDVIAAMLNIADSRFQDQLLDQAKTAKKIAPGYQIPDRHRNNTPERLREIFKPARDDGYFPKFPFGTDLTPDEIRVGRGLRWLEAQTVSKISVAKLIVSALVGNPSVPAYKPLLERLDLAAPKDLSEKMLARLVTRALKATE